MINELVALGTGSLILTGDGLVSSQSLKSIFECFVSEDMSAALLESLGLCAWMHLKY